MHLGDCTFFLYNWLFLRCKPYQNNRVSDTMQQRHHQNSSIQNLTRESPYLVPMGVVQKEFRTHWYTRNIIACNDIKKFFPSLAYLYKSIHLSQVSSLYFVLSINKHQRPHDSHVTSLQCCVRLNVQNCSVIGVMKAKSRIAATSTGDHMTACILRMLG